MGRMSFFFLFVLLFVSVSSAQTPELAPLAAGNPGEGGFVSWIDTSKLVVPAEVAGKLSAPLPASFDWRTVGTTPAGNQGGCGACWIFAGMGDFESKIKIDGLGEKDLSEQEVLDCNPSNETCASGGNAWAFFNHVNQNCSVLEGDYPFTGSDGSCTPIAARQERALQMRTLADDSPGVARDWIKQTIMDHGPVYTVIKSNFAQFANYAGRDYGMYSPPGTPDHGVLLVGWDNSKAYFDEYPPNLGDPAGYGCWIVKNSWGPAWGQNGFGYVGYGAASVATQNSYISEYADCSTDIGEVLRYDHGYSGYLVGYPGVFSPYGAVKFTTTSSEDITGVGFYVPITGEQYEIRIYENANPATNTWTTQLAFLRGTLTEGGYHMIDINPPIPIPADNDFWIRLRLTNPANSWPYIIGVDVVRPFESGKCYLSDYGSIWDDVSGSYDLAIHARLGGPEAPTPTPPATGLEEWDTYH